MIKSEPIIGVIGVEKSAEWYQKLLHCNCSPGGDTFEMLLIIPEKYFFVYINGANMTTQLYLTKKFNEEMD